MLVAASAQAGGMQWTRDLLSLNAVGASSFIVTPILVVNPFDASFTGGIRFQELAANGANYVQLAAPSALTSTVELVLPTSVPAAGQVLGILAAAGNSARMEWVTGGAGGGVDSAYVLSVAKLVSVQAASALSEALSAGDAVVSGLDADISNLTSAHNALSVAHALLSNRVSANSGIGGGLTSTISVDGVVASSYVAAPIVVVTPFDASFVGAMRFHELSVNGGNYIQLAAAPAITSTVELVWPTSTPTAGQVLGILSATGNSAQMHWTTGGGGGVASTDIVTAIGYEAKGPGGYVFVPGVVIRETSATATGQLHFRELSANGAHVIGFNAPSALADHRFFTWPEEMPTAGQVLAASTVVGTAARLGWVTPGGGGADIATSAQLAALSLELVSAKSVGDATASNLLSNIAAVSTRVDTVSGAVGVNTAGLASINGPVPRYSRLATRRWYPRSRSRRSPGSVWP